MLSNFNTLDFVFAALALIFVATAFFRGFVKEMFSIFNWLVALTFSHLLAPYVAEFLASYIKNKLAADITARSAIFIIVFIIAAITTSGLRKDLQEKIPNSFNRSLGVLFGLIKTLLVFGLFYSITVNTYESLLGKTSEAKKQLPAWLKDAKCFGILRTSGEIIDPVVKVFFDAALKNFDQVIPKSKDELDQKIDEVIDEKTSEKTPLKSDSEKSGYNKKDIEKMNHLIEIIDK